MSLAAAYGTIPVAAGLFSLLAELSERHTGTTVRLEELPVP